jgi:hypothetical protein
MNALIWELVGAFLGFPERPARDGEFPGFEREGIDGVRG